MHAIKRPSGGNKQINKTNNLTNETPKFRFENVMLRSIHLNHDNLRFHPDAKIHLPFKV